MSFRVLTYNIHCDGEYMSNNADSMRTFTRFIDSVNADVVCFQEFNENKLKDLVKALKKRYSYSTHKLFEDKAHEKYPDSEYLRMLSMRHALFLFSKYPINKVCQFEDKDSIMWRLLKDKGGLEQRGYSKNMSIYHVTMDVQGSTVNVICGLLASNWYSTAIKHLGDSLRWIDGIPDYYKTIDIGYEARAIQADMIRDSIKTYKGSILMCGDFNDLSGSYTLRTIQDDRLHDAWWRAGCGFGFTYAEHNLLLRLDHILYSDEFKIKDCKVLTNYKFSDHYPIVADFELRSK